MPTTALDSPLPESSHCDGSGPACTLTAYLPPHSVDAAGSMQHAAGSMQQAAGSRATCSTQHATCSRPAATATGRQTSYGYSGYSTSTHGEPGKWSPRSCALISNGSSDAGVYVTCTAQPCAT